MSMPGTIGLIWAQGQGGVIGAEGGIPWRLPEDLRRFRRLTLGDRVVMGRRTWESLPLSARPLPGRANIVVTRQEDYEAPGARVAHTVEEAVRDGGWVIGGGTLYAATLPLADTVEVTEVEVGVAGDTWAPRIDQECFAATRGTWQESAAGLRYRFVTWRRRRATTP